MAAVNLAGCVLFGISALASFVVPATGSVVDLAAASGCTVLGALCFLIGSLMLIPRPGAEPPPPEVRQAQASPRPPTAANFMRSGG